MSDNGAYIGAFVRASMSEACCFANRRCIYSTFRRLEEELDDILITPACEDVEYGGIDNGDVVDFYYPFERYAIKMAISKNISKVKNIKKYNPRAFDEEYNLYTEINYELQEELGIDLGISKQGNVYIEKLKPCKVTFFQHLWTYIIGIICGHFRIKGKRAWF